MLHLPPTADFLAAPKPPQKWQDLTEAPRNYNATDTRTPEANNWKMVLLKNWKCRNDQNRVKDNTLPITQPIRTIRFVPSEYEYHTLSERIMNHELLIDHQRFLLYRFLEMDPPRYYDQPTPNTCIENFIYVIHIIRNLTALIPFGTQNDAYFHTIMGLLQVTHPQMRLVLLPTDPTLLTFNYLVEDHESLWPWSSNENWKNKQQPRDIEHFICHVVATLFNVNLYETDYWHRVFPRRIAEAQWRKDPLIHNPYPYKGLEDNAPLDHVPFLAWCKDHRRTYYKETPIMESPARTVIEQRNKYEIKDGDETVHNVLSVRVQILPQARQTWFLEARERFPAACTLFLNDIEHLRPKFTDPTTEDRDLRRPFTKEMRDDWLSRYDKWDFYSQPLRARWPDGTHVPYIQRPHPYQGPGNLLLEQRYAEAGEEQFYDATHEPLHSVVRRTTRSYQRGYGDYGKTRSSSMSSPDTKRQKVNKVPARGFPVTDRCQVSPYRFVHLLTTEAFNNAKHYGLTLFKLQNHPVHYFAMKQNASADELHDTAFFCANLLLKNYEREPISFYEHGEEYRCKSFFVDGIKDPYHGQYITQPPRNNPELPIITRQYANYLLSLGIPPPTPTQEPTQTNPTPSPNQPEFEDAVNPEDIQLHKFYEVRPPIFFEIFDQPSADQTEEQQRIVIERQSLSSSTITLEHDRKFSRSSSSDSIRQSYRSKLLD